MAKNKIHTTLAREDAAERLAEPVSTRNRFPGQHQ